jgi:hypothetical protein
MKNLNFLTLGVAAGVASLIPMVGRAGLADTPNPHNFSLYSWNINPADPKTICGPCHQPHNADSTVVPLWGHTTSAGPWTMYSTLNSPSFKAAPSETKIDAPNGTSARASLACLSCHDGTVAINSYGGQIQGGGVGTKMLPGSTGFISPDLTHTHPISFTYDKNLVGPAPTQDKFLYDPDATLVLQPDDSPFVVGNDMTVNGFLLNGNHRVECTSCHDVHNQVGSPYNFNNNPSLVKINGTKGGLGSLLCRSCHIK